MRLSIKKITYDDIKDRTECLEDHLHDKKNEYKVKHAKRWLKLFVYKHNQEIIS